jgi:hypothetical protein
VCLSLTSCIYCISIFVCILGLTFDELDSSKTLLPQHGQIKLSIWFEPVVKYVAGETHASAKGDPLDGSIQPAESGCF